MNSLDKHFAASGFVINPEETKVLLIFHKKLNKWLIPGGHVNKNESPDEAVLREIKEEVGLTPRFVGNFNDKLKLNSEKQRPIPYCILEELIPQHKDKREHIHIDFIYILQSDKQDKIVNNEIHEINWVSKSEISDLDTFDSIKQICNNIIKT